MFRSQVTPVASSSGHGNFQLPWKSNMFLLQCLKFRASIKIRFVGIKMEKHNDQIFVETTEDN